MTMTQQLTATLTTKQRQSRTFYSPAHLERLTDGELAQAIGTCLPMTGDALIAYRVEVTLRGRFKYPEVSGMSDEELAAVWGRAQKAPTSDRNYCRLHGDVFWRAVVCDELARRRTHVLSTLTPERREMFEASVRQLSEIAGSVGQFTRTCGLGDNPLFESVNTAMYAVDELTYGLKS